MIVGAFIQRLDREAETLLRRSGHTIMPRTAALHVDGETESFDLVVVLAGSPNADQIARDYRARGREVRVLERHQLATLGEGSKKADERR